jgi:hypothetical protein
MMESLFLYTLMFVIIAAYVLSKFRPPRRDKNLHNYTDAAINAGQKKYEEVLTLNASFEDRELLEKYANLVKEAIQSLHMYLATTEIEEIEEVERQAIYWMYWIVYYQKQFSKLGAKHHFVTEKSE